MTLMKNLHSLHLDLRYNLMIKKISFNSLGIEYLQSF